ncbi:MAG: DNA circularization N-terminal domain-containing protein [Desulfobacteraceae bacterium]|nr:DNA circularization N-terminal domain-containing protein [Desulfobacteraceae bacterium]
MADREFAEIDGYGFECENLDDGWEMAIDRKEYPWRDGAELTNMGQTGRTVRIRCYWLENRYPDHFAFLEHLKSRELFELNHPAYGVIKGLVQAVSVRHDDRLQTAEVDLTFVEDLLSQEESIIYLDVAASAEEAFVSGQAELADYFTRGATAALGGEARGILGKTLNPALGIVAQFSGVSTAARRWLTGVESAVTTWQTTLAAIANPANTLISTIEYGLQLPGRVIGPVARLIERYAILRESIATAPERFIDHLRQDLADVRAATLDLLGAADHPCVGSVVIAGAQRIALAAGTAYKEDEARRDAVRRVENQSAFDAAGNRLPTESVAPVLDVRALERSLAQVRTQIQAAIDIDRAQPALKKAAADLLRHVNVIKLERDRIARIALDNTLPLHLVCLMRGLPYQMAERILAINPKIAHPTFADGEVDIYVR